MQAQNDYNILGIDYGSKRVGIALAHAVAKLPHPFTILPNDETLADSLKQLIVDQNVKHIVLGLPVPLESAESYQTKEVRLFGGKIESELSLPVSYVNESLSSVMVERRASGGAAQYVDDLAASEILERFFAGETETKGIA